MSYTTIARAATDDALIKRVRAAIAQEAFANPVLKLTKTGQAIAQSGPDMVIAKFLWPLCVSSAADYAYAVDAGNSNPGGDPGVVNDAAIAASVQANWPSDALVQEPFKYLKVVAVTDFPAP